VREPLERRVGGELTAANGFEERPQPFPVHGRASYQKGASAASPGTSAGIHTSSTAGWPPS
jgi:hypothetical protein